MPKEDKETEAAKERVRQFFSKTAADKLKAKGGHPAMRLVQSKKGGLKLKTYVAEGANRLTGMHVLRQGNIDVVLGDMLKGADAYYPVETPASEGKIESRSHEGKWHKVLYYGGETPRDILGTIEEITSWFADHGDHAFVIRQQDKDPYDDTKGRAADWYGSMSFTAEVRLVSFAKKGDRGYVNLGGLGTGIQEAFKGLIGLVPGAVAGNVGGGKEGSKAVEAIQGMVGEAPDLYDISTRLTGKEPKAKPGEFKFDIDLAKQFLEIAVTVHEAAGPIRKSDFHAFHTWNEVPERGIKPGSDGAKLWPVISVRRVGNKVVNELIPDLFGQLEAAAK